jgi:hypothetical protein
MAKKGKKGPPDPAAKALAERLMRRSFNLRVNVENIHKGAALAIANNVISSTPLWSGQARLNWTAHVGKRKPKQRFVNVPRSNSRIRKTKDGPRVSQGTQGGFRHISVDPVVAATAGPVAREAVTAVISGYKHPVPKTARLNDVRSSSRRGSPKIYLSNSIKYIGKLWNGTWPSNPQTLESQLQFGARVVRAQSGRLFSRR